MFDCIIHNKESDTYMAPAVSDGATVEYVISGAPGKLSFSVYRDEKLRFQEGDTVQIAVNGQPFFYGYVFTRSQNRDDEVKVTAYDLLRYLKNKESFQYKGKTAKEVIAALAGDYQLPVGDLADTDFVIDKRTEDNATLFDIMQNALDITLVHTKKLYVLYDDFGQLTLREPKDMEVPILIDNETAQSFSYESSIDGDTYNLIKLAADEGKEGERAIYYAPSDPDAFAKTKEKNQWGVLQYYEKISKNIQNPQERANQMLAFYRVARRKLSVRGCAGDGRVRAGSLVYVTLRLSDITVAQKMLVTAVTHCFENDLHTMDVTLKGGVIND